MVKCRVPGRGCDRHRRIDRGRVGLRQRRVADRRPACGQSGLGHAHHPGAQDRDGRGPATTDSTSVRIAPVFPLTVPSPPRPRRDPSTGGGRHRAFGRREPSEGSRVPGSVPARLGVGSGVTVRVSCGATRMRAVRPSPRTERSDRARDRGQPLAGPGFRETVMAGAPSRFKAGLEPVDPIRLHPLPRVRACEERPVRALSGP